MNIMRNMAKTQKTSELFAIVTSPEFEKLIQEIEDTPSADQLAFARSIATPSELRKRGIVLPDGVGVNINSFGSNGATDTSKTHSTSKSVLDGHWSICIGTVVTVCYQF